MITTANSGGDEHAEQRDQRAVQVRDNIGRHIGTDRQRRTKLLRRLAHLRRLARPNAAGTRLRYRTETLSPTLC